MSCSDDSDMTEMRDLDLIVTITTRTTTRMDETHVG